MIKKVLALFTIALLAISSLSAAALLGNSPNVAAVNVGDNLIANPSVEQAAGTKPVGWSTDKWGTNTTAFTYNSTGHTGSRSVKVKTTSYKSGDAKWYFTAVNVLNSTNYTFSDWYTSTTSTDVDVVSTNTAGQVSYLWQGTLPASAAWKQATFKFKTPAKAKTVTVFHYIHAVGEVNTDDYSLIQDAPGSVPPAPIPTAPTVNITAPANNASVAGTVNVTATAGGVSPITSVQFKLDGNNLGGLDTTAPYATPLDTTTLVNGSSHVLTAVATNLATLSTTSTAVNVTVNNPTAPVVTMTAPANNATVTGTQTISATATSNVPITSVQFTLNGNNFGSPVTGSPYNLSWDTTTVANGSYVLGAVAKNSANQTGTATTFTVNVNNPVIPVPPTPVNMLQNPSVELNSGGQPTGWTGGSWGNNTSTFTYNNTGRTGTHSLGINVTSYTDGAADWSFTPLAVQSGGTYQYSNWYKSTIDTEIDIEVHMADNSTQYFYLTVAPASPNDWLEVKGTFTMPVGATTATFFQPVTKVGTVTEDDFSLTPYTPTHFNRGIISLTFDDGWRSIYTNGLPALNAHGMVSTEYMLTDTISFPDYMDVAMMQAMKDAGNEIASHTVSHAHLPTLTAAQLNHELADSQTQLRAWFGPSPVADNFATPYGEYNTTVLDAIKALYRSHRSVDVGYNTKDSFNIYNIKVQNIYSTTTADEVNAWVSQALTDKSWLVLVYHEIDTTPEDLQYSTTPATLNAMLDKVQASGIAVETVNQALDEIVPQL